MSRIKLCSTCNTDKVCTKSLGNYYCSTHFILKVEEHVFQFLNSRSIFNPHETIGVGISGGKDSVVLAHIMAKWVRLHSPTNKLVLLAIDEGIVGYRDASLAAVHAIKADLDLPLKVLSYEELYEGYTMDKVVKITGNKRNCSYCGVFRRSALTKAAKLMNVDVVATGHNREDMLETYYLNLFRGDVERIQRTMAPRSYELDDDGITRVKPFFTLAQRSIVLYAELTGLKYFSVECPYSPVAFRGFIRNFLITLSDETLHKAIEGLIYENQIDSKTHRLKNCINCNEISSNELCAKCLMIKDLNDQSISLLKTA